MVTLSCLEFFPFDPEVHLLHCHVIVDSFVFVFAPEVLHIVNDLSFVHLSVCQFVHFLVSLFPEKS